MLKSNVPLLWDIHLTIRVLCMYFIHNFMIMIPCFLELYGLQVCICYLGLVCRWLMRLNFELCAMICKTRPKSFNLFNITLLRNMYVDTHLLRTYDMYDKHVSYENSFLVKLDAIYHCKENRGPHWLCASKYQINCS